MTGADARRTRRILDVSLAELAAEVGVTKQYLSEAETRDGGQALYPPDLEAKCKKGLTRIAKRKLKALTAGLAALEQPAEAVA